MITCVQDCRKSKQKMKRSRTENETVDAAAPASRGDGKDVKKKRPSVEGKTTRCSTDGNEGGGGQGNHQLCLILLTRGI